MWLAPEQARILPVSDKQLDLAKEFQKELRAKGFRVGVDAQAAGLGAKIRAARSERVPYLLVLGEKEAENRTLAVRNRNEGEIGEIAGVRFVQTTEAKIYDGGVFGSLFFGEGAYGTTDIAGGGMETIVKQKGSAGTADPLDQRSSVGWKGLKTAELLIEQYLVRVESKSAAFSDSVEAN